ncbi:MAG: glycoside hydrolase family 2 TIM barrel-domain containing protein [Candidatus Cryptobacteroides sp.]
MSIKRMLFVAAAAMFASGLLPCYGQRTEVLLEKDWKFHLGDVPEAFSLGYDDSSWQDVTIPHDWAIYGPFSRDIDLQPNDDGSAVMTGRTGGLPYVGCGWYRRNFAVESGKRTTLLFDGAMSEARVYVNGKEVCFWPYGYNAFHCDVTGYVHPGENELAVRLENLPQSSRWYPGAGLYRNVHLIQTSDVRIPVWGTYVTTPDVCADYASVRLETLVDGADGRRVDIRTEIIDADGICRASSTKNLMVREGEPLLQTFIVDAPRLWSPESPSLYVARTVISIEGQELDRYSTTFGIRKIEYIPQKGFFLNGEVRKFKGVCNHHDLGPLGAAVNESALRHQIEMLKDMGCDAIRTSHNVPAPELVRLCDEMGIMMMVEAFDEWDVAKCVNGYHRFYDEWAERDMVNMLHHFRNNPSVMMWSVGNEVPSQLEADGWKTGKFLQDICHREDPTRPVTCGINYVKASLANGFIDTYDIVGINYHPWNYIQVHDKVGHGLVLGSETGSTVSSRGVYKFPVQRRFSVSDEDHHSNSYEVDACKWSNVPEVDFSMQDDYPWVIGQFVWTGFDYLGEPTPYDNDAWPNHSSMFGIIDLASIPKDRFYLFRSQWNTEDATLHILPHWNWKGHEGEGIPVHLFTSWPSAELFLNGESQGIRYKVTDAPKSTGSQKNNDVDGRYRLMWDSVPYSPGELMAVAYDSEGNPADTAYVRTAGNPHHIELSASRTALAADGKDLAYITASVVDKDGNLCPVESRMLTFETSGAGSFKATANGDPTCLLPFHEPRMNTFSGKLTVIVQSSESVGNVVLTVRSKGLGPAVLTIPVTK